MPEQDTTSFQTTIRKWLPQDQYCLEHTLYVDVESPRQPLDIRCWRVSMLLLDWVMRKTDLNTPLFWCRYQRG
eukprot:9119340-Prorocentrum_lima.AAC.1